jgi:hypothetical protein
VNIGARVMALLNFDNTKKPVGAKLAREGGVSVDIIIA